MVKRIRKNKAAHSTRSITGTDGQSKWELLPAVRAPHEAPSFHHGPVASLGSPAQTLSLVPDSPVFVFSTGDHLLQRKPKQ